MVQPAHFIFILLCLVIIFPREVRCFRVSLGHGMRLPTKFYGGNILKSDTNEIRVQLLEDVERIGLKGDILHVSKEQWMNVLMPRKLSTIVHDYESQKIDKAMLVMAQRRADERNEMIKCITDLPILEMKEHASENLYLKEVVTGKKMLDLLKKHLEPKQVAKMTVKEIEMDDIVRWKESIHKFTSFYFKKRQEIRKAGLYQVVLKLKVSEERFPYQVRIIPIVPDIVM